MKNKLQKLEKVRAAFGDPDWIRFIKLGDLVHKYASYPEVEVCSETENYQCPHCCKVSNYRNDFFYQVDDYRFECCSCGEQSLIPAFKFEVVYEYFKLKKFLYG